MKRKFVVIDQNALSAEGHFKMYSSSVALAAHEAGHEVTVFWNKRFPLDSISAPYRMAQHFSFTEGEAASRGILPTGDGHFGCELERALVPLRLGSNDIVFIHTCHFVEFAELLETLVNLFPDRRLPYVHIMLRYDPDIFRPRLGRLARQFSIITRSDLLRDKIRFHCDTRLLAEEFQKLFGAPFGVCPIPIDRTTLLPALRNAPKRPPECCDPLVISYLGTARMEKGYHEILEAISYLRGDYLSNNRAHFVLQCSSKSIKSEPGLLEYQRRLEKYIQDHNLQNQVHLVKEIVDSQTYYSMLARSDILLVGYSATNYRLRSSSVLVEAMAAGKVVLTTQGSWMASCVTPDHAVVYSDSHELGPAAAKAIDHFAELDVGAKARQAKALAESDSQAVLDYLIKTSPAVEAAPGEDPAPLILIVVNADTTASIGGTGLIWTRRLRYFHAAGYRLAALFLSKAPLTKQAALRRRLSSELRPYKFEMVFIGHSNAASTDRVSSYDFQSELSLFLEEARPDCVYLDRTVNVAMIETLNLGDRLTICEAECLGVSQSDHGPEYFNVETLSRRGHIIAIGEREARRIRARAPSASVKNCGMPFDAKSLDVHVLAGARDCAEVVASAKPWAADLQLEAATAAHPTRRRSRLSALSSLDILLVCSANAPDVSGLRWFLERVYGPFLAEHHLSLIVVGDVDALGGVPYFEDVIFVGGVDFLDPLYGAAKVIVLPFVEDDGAAIGTYEALSKCKPVVATTAAVKGFEDFVAGLEIHDDASLFARAILRLLESMTARVDAANNSLAAMNRLGGFQSNYFARMNELSGFLLGARAKFATALNDAEPQLSHLIEWTPAIRDANRIVRDYAAGEPIEFSGELARTGDQGRRLLRDIARCVLEERRAAILHVDGGPVRLLAKPVGAWRSEDVSEIVEVAQSFDTVYASATPVRSGRVVINRHFSGAVIAVARGERAPNLDLSADNARIAFAPAVRDCGATIRWEFASDEEEDKPELATLVLPHREDVDWFVFQRVRVSRDARVLGRPVFVNWRFTDDTKIAKARLLPAAILKRMQRDAGHKGGFFAGLARGRRTPLHKWLPWVKANPLFDANWYVGQYPDMKTKGIAPFKHYDRHGIYEGRDPNAFFDTDWYFERYPDVRRDNESPLTHYLETGAFQGCDPGPHFSSLGYFDKNPDVREWGLNPLLHYLRFGHGERRETRPAESAYPPQTILLPIVTGYSGDIWIEVRLDVDPNCKGLSFLELDCNGQKLDLPIEEREEGAIARTVVHSVDARRFGFFAIQLALPEAGAQQSVAVLEIRVGWSSSNACNRGRAFNWPILESEGLCV